MMTTLFLHKRTCVLGSTIHVIEFPRVSWNGWAPYREDFISDSDKHSFRYAHLSSSMWTSDNVPQVMSTCINKGNDDQHFHCVCWADIDIAMEKHHPSEHQRPHPHPYWQLKPWLGLRCCEQETMTLQRVGAVYSIQLCNTIPIRIQYKCLPPWEELLKEIQYSWSQQHNWPQSLDLEPWLTAPTSWVRE